MNSTFTSESVAAGHPDKLADQISDAVLDYALSKDPFSRVAVETLVTKNQVVMAGEVTSKTKIPYRRIARKVIKDLGYTNEKFGFWYKSPIQVRIQKQSPDIAQGVDQDGAGDQGMMFGYACTHTNELMPLPIMLAHDLVRRLDHVRVQNILGFIRPDGKAQVSINYQSGRPQSIDHLTMAVAHTESIKPAHLKSQIINHVINPVLSNRGFKVSPSNVVINGTGRWHIPGPASDAGLTGRKIIVDTYGGWARVGGGAFSGKDPTKVDRSGAYAARFIAKNIVANGLTKECEVRLAYFIGARRPVMQEIETFGTHKSSLKTIKDFAGKLIDTSVKSILETLDLRRPIYRPTAVYGHFGRDQFPWEQII